jgi:cyclic pyranopterin phosphate synthase
MPAEIFGARYAFLPRPELLSFEEIERLARLFAQLGVEKLRITGGEPLLRAELPKLIRQLARIAGVRDLTLTTNGMLLERQAAALAEAGLHRISVSLDSHDESVFRQMSGGRDGPRSVLAGIEAAVRAGLTPVKVNCVVQRGVNDGGIVELARAFQGSGVILRFIEYMDVGTLNRWELAHVVPAREILERIDAVMPLEPVARHYRGEVASRYRYRDGSGEIGLIASVSQPFCGDCTRARLSTDGKLVTCLFATGGTDLRGPLRAGESDDELRARIAAVWRLRSDRYSEERAANTDLGGQAGPRPKIEMYQIGG